MSKQDPIKYLVENILLLEIKLLTMSERLLYLGGKWTVHLLFIIWNQSLRYFNFY